MKTWFTITAAAKGQPAEVFLYEEIGAWGVSAQQFIDAVRALGDVEINVRINSPGGDAFAGIAMNAYLAGRKGVTNVIVDGVAASAASLVAMAGKEIRMAEASFLMIHNPLTFAVGDGDDMRKVAGVLDSIRDSYAKVYAARSGKTVEQAKEWMADESWFSAEKAVELGLATSVVEGLKAAACAGVKKYTKAPSAVISEAEPSTNNQPKQEMKNLMKALAEQKLVASVDVSEDTAVHQFGAAFSAQAQACKDATERADKAEKELAEANAKLAAQAKTNAETAVAQLVKDGKLKDDATIRLKWVEAFVRDFDGTKAMADSIEVKAARGADPLKTVQNGKTVPVAGAVKATADLWDEAFKK